MKQANKQLLIALVLAVAFCGTFAISSKSRAFSFLQVKTDFIPNRCNASDTESCDDTPLPGTKFPVCVCFWNGTCEFRDDKSSCQWCNEEGAASVNEGERCPDLHGNVLHICPTTMAKPIHIIDPNIVGPMIPAEAPEESAETPIATDPITIGPMIPAESVEESAEAEAQPTHVVIGPMKPASKRKTSSSQPIQPAKATRGCVCTEDGCKRVKVSDWWSNCYDKGVVAVIEEGTCPKASACKLKQPEGAYKCTKADRIAKKFCPRFVVTSGCICYKDGTCKSQPASTCSGCTDETVVSITQNQDCDCV